MVPRVARRVTIKGMRAFCSSSRQLAMAWEMDLSKGVPLMGEEPEQRMMTVMKLESFITGPSVGRTQSNRGCLRNFCSARKARTPLEMCLPESLDQVCNGNSPAVKASL